MAKTVQMARCGIRAAMHSMYVRHNWWYRQASWNLADSAKRYLRRHAQRHGGRT